MTIGYGAFERFVLDDNGLSGELWPGLPRVKEIISLDGSLCPSLITDWTDEDRKHSLADEGEPWYFRDLDYLLSKIATHENHQILAVIPNPAAHEEIGDDGFEFIGYDLVPISVGHLRQRFSS